MARDVLIRVETSRLLFEISGTPTGPSGIIGDPSTPAHLLVEPGRSTSNLSVQVRDGDALVDAQLSEGPWLFEDAAYQVDVQGPDGSRTSLWHRDPVIASQVTPLANHPNLLRGVVTFRSQVGRSRFEIRLDGVVEAIVEVEVAPTKLNYERDFRQMVSGIERVTRALALEYLRSTYQGAAATRETRPTELEWALLLRAEVERLEQAIAFVSRLPWRRLERETAFVQAHRLKRPRPVTWRAAASGRGQGSVAQTKSGRLVRDRLPTAAAVETADTPEHRWLKREILAAHRRVSHLAAETRATVASATRKRDLTPREKSEIAELQQATSALARMARSDLFVGVGTRVPPRFSSIGLMRRSGYRDAYQSLLRLRLGVEVGGGPLEVSMKDVSQLFEMWCFFALVELVVAVTRGAVTSKDIFSVTRKGLRVRLDKGARQAVVVDAVHQKLRITYGPYYAGITGGQQPDIVLESDRDGWPPLHIAFDAKYRVDATPDYVGRFGSVGPPIDAVNALHRYRDAIVLADAQRTRPVVRGAALFPLDSEMVEGFRGSRLHRALDVHGIGALPFLPSTSRLVRAWVADMVRDPTSDLARPGPPYAGLVELSSRAQAGERVVLVLPVDSPADADALGRAAFVPLDFTSGMSPTLLAAVVVVRRDRGTDVLESTAEVTALSAQGRFARPLLLLAEHQGLGDRLVADVDPPSWTTELAIRRATRTSELSIHTARAWDAYESLRRAGLHVAVVPHASMISLEHRFRIGRSGDAELLVRDSSYLVQLPGGRLLHRRELGRVVRDFLLALDP